MLLQCQRIKKILVDHLLKYLSNISGEQGPHFVYSPSAQLLFSPCFKTNYRYPSAYYRFPSAQSQLLVLQYTLFVYFVLFPKLTMAVGVLILKDLMSFSPCSMIVRVFMRKKNEFTLC